MCVRGQAATTWAGPCSAHPPMTSRSIITSRVARGPSPACKPRRDQHVQDTSSPFRSTPLVRVAEVEASQTEPPPTALASLQHHLRLERDGMAPRQWMQSLWRTPGCGCPLARMRPRLPGAVALLMQSRARYLTSQPYLPVVDD